MKNVGPKTKSRVGQYKAVKTAKGQIVEQIPVVYSDTYCTLRRLIHTKAHTHACTDTHTTAAHKDKQPRKYTHVNML